MIYLYVFNIIYILLNFILENMLLRESSDYIFRPLALPCIILIINIYLYILCSKQDKYKV